MRPNDGRPRKPGTVVLGGTDFFEVMFPLIVGDRYFTFSLGPKGQLLADVFWWDPETKKATYEVMNGKPVAETVATNPTGVLTWTQEGGAWEFKVRPEPGLSQVFGTVPGSHPEMRAKITDRGIEGFGGDGSRMSIERGFRVAGMAVGLRVTMSGVTFGANTPPEGMETVRRAG